jgi:hypothetical protein
MKEEPGNITRFHSGGLHHGRLNFQTGFPKIIFDIFSRWRDRLQGFGDNRRSSNKYSNPCTVSHSFSGRHGISVLAK